ncbi:uncharacterized protein LOC123717843 [Pieris brassicae]|uniref:uncharacterized protein LOC123717843 n=1 Tax=Pieris brassicae TaxID=7116 RepID=UPI001E65FEDA|nr:uncharacterized protein LOC123717843 [Pieris brassicae]XP_045530039.1 uncharacterized protein LOC123717843 [Pieris brassicae]XP_045530040.1 uncharacterized protein LOC123717843 [Pieris brassicae]
MYKIEVDPKLFITCRLCLDEMGQYQIDPNVQTQIKYCFDIDVDPFDGLPQLICKKCETILSDFHEKKKTYQEKQLGLKKNAKPANNCIVTAPLQQQDTVSSTQSTIPETKPQQSFKLTLKKKRKSPEPNSNDSLVTKNHDTKTVRPWRKNYNKYFSCRLCQVVYKNKKILMTHMEKHGTLLEKYGHILKKCKIQLPRIDDKTNFVSSNDMVVMNEDQILLNKYDQYRVIYIKKTSGFQEKKNSSDSSDDDLITKGKRKRLRLVSQSSNETVVLEDPKKEDDLETPGSSKSKLQNHIIECVDIDSSDQEPSSPKTYEGRKQIIREVVASCVKKYLNNDNDNCKDMQLKHKILSIGRKVVNNKSFNCTGLLRYLEHKNLDIEWIPRVSQNPETDYVHVRTKVLDNKNDGEAGWMIASELKGSDSNTYMENLQKILENDKLPTPVQNSTEEPTVEQQVPYDNTDTMLLKLLNTNPVANPKQLPKKTREATNITDSSSDTSLSMPIITNTVSLADTMSEQVNEKSKEPTPFVPRIKVKPVSQLMPDKSTTITETTPAQVAWTIPEKPQNQISQPDWVVMHTVELPRTKTLSPFKYFQNLLQMHGITLLDTTALVPSDFVSLIKFKSVFKQETKRVTLSLGLLSDSRQFYIKVTESTNEQLDINTLIPTWQWEILSLYKSEIAINILENSKKISQKMYDSTNYFISLLRSIVFIRP